MDTTRINRTGTSLISLGGNAAGSRFYRAGRHSVVVIHNSRPARVIFYCTWACWLTLGHRLAGVVLGGDGAIVGARA
jgi:hypothetical protein